ASHRARGGGCRPRRAQPRERGDGNGRGCRARQYRHSGSERSEPDGHGLPHGGRSRRRGLRIRLGRAAGHRQPDQPVDGFPGLTARMRAKRDWIMPLLAALVVACVGWWADRELSEVMQEELTDDLRTMLDADVTALEIWMANQKRIAE